MTEVSVRHPQRKVRRVTVADIFVFCAMLIVALAIGVGLVLHGGLPTPAAGLFATLFVVSAATGHLMMRRERMVADLSAEMTRLESELVRLSRSPADAPVLTPGPDPEAIAAMKPEAPAPAKKARREKVPGDRPNDRPSDSEDADGPSRLSKHVKAPPPLPPQYVDAIADAEQGAVRTKDVPEPEPIAAQLKITPLGSVVPDRGGDGRKDGKGASRLKSPPPTRIDDIIKRLATDISAGRKSPELPLPKKSKERPIAEAPETPFAIRPEDFFAPPSATEVTHEQAALQAPTGAPASKVAAIADALLNENVDVFLEPIHGLDDQKARHYEVSARLRLADGTSLDQKAYAEVARGTGLLPLIDAVKVSNTKRVALQLIGRGRTGSFFSQIAGESLETSQFGDDVGTITGRDPDIATRLVLSFPQADVRGFAKAHWTALEELRDLGFRFAIEDMTDLDMDFDRLARRGFAFAKLDAGVFVRGLPAAGGNVPASDICHHLARAGLTLIVQAITSERQLAEILGFGVLFGQGTMFGGPRPVKAHVLREDGPRGELSVSA